jgi:hypothetical protein
MADMPGRFLKARALWELLRYDAVSVMRGFRGVRKTLRPCDPRTAPQDGIETAICDAVEWAAVLYWKRVLCLQRAIVAVRLLRAYNVPAQLVIGCRVAPFAGHAWVESNGRVLFRPAAYPDKLQVLERV